MYSLLQEGLYGSYYTLPLADTLFSKLAPEAAMAKRLLLPSPGK